MEISRDNYLRELLDRRQNGLIKFITGLSHSGKTYLLFKLFYKRLLENGVPEDHILKLSLSNESEWSLRNYDEVMPWIKSQIKDGKPYYLLADEIHLFNDGPAVLNSCQHIGNLDIYAICCNLNLFTNLNTEYRGRWEVIHVYPLSFAEFLPICNLPEKYALDEYLRYGGMPYLSVCESEKPKKQFLLELLQKNYLQEIVGINHIHRFNDLKKTIAFYASTTGSFLSMRGLENTFRAEDKESVSINTIRAYSLYLQSIFLIDMVTRFDIKKRKHIASPVKFYFEDPGIRNACLKFQNFDKGQLMENVIYNELRRRNYSVDTGIITAYKTNPDSSQTRKYLAVDFIANLGDRRYYIQSVPQIYYGNDFDMKKEALTKIRDGFRKIVVTYDDISSYHNEDGFLIIGLAEFLKNGNSLNL